MAEALAGLSIAANVIAVADFALKIVDRLEEYRASYKELPTVFDYSSRRLKALSDGLTNTKNAIDTGALEKRSRDALRPLLSGCHAQIQLLSDIIDKAVPGKGSSSFRRTWMALVSLRYDSKVEKINRTINGYVQDLTFHAVSTKYIAPADVSFVERESIMTAIETKSALPSSRVGLIGLGGVGKSQLAIEYSYRLRDRSPETWVFWINAETRFSVEKGFRDIALQADIAAWDDSADDRFRAVSQWLSDEANGQWLIVIDNADDLESFVPKSPAVTKAGRQSISTSLQRNLLDFFPPSPHGSYLVTARDRKVAYRIVGEYKDLIEVKEMNEEEAILLLKRTLVNPVEESLAKILVGALDCMPLAVNTAANAINEMWPRMTVEKYIEIYRKGDEDRNRLLKEDIYDARRDGKRSNSIIITWHISFEYIRRVHPSAARLLSLMSLFHRQNIPEELLVSRYAETSKPNSSKWPRRRRKHQGQTQETKLDDNESFNNDWKILTNFSLIVTELDGTHFAMHSLVQFSMTKWLELHGEIGPWRTRYLELMKDSFPDPRDVFIDRHCVPLIFHAYAALTTLPAIEDNPKYALLLFKVALFGSAAGFHDAVMTLKEAHQVLQLAFGRENPITLECARELARELCRENQTDEGFDLLRRNLDIKKTNLGPKHPDTIAAMDNLADAVHDYGDVKEADELWLSSIFLKEEAYGRYHEHVISAMEVRILPLTFDGRYDEAVSMARRCHAIRKKIHGDKLDTGWCADVHFIAIRCWWGGKFEYAENLHREVLEYKRRLQPVDDKDTILTITWLADALDGQGRCDEAELLYRESIDFYTSNRDQENQLRCMQSLAWCLCKHGDPRKAEASSKDYLLECEKSPDIYRENIGGAHSLLGQSMLKQQRLEESLQHYTLALNIFRDLHGDDHIDSKEISQDLQAVQEQIEKREALKLDGKVNDHSNQGQADALETPKSQQDKPPSANDESDQSVTIERVSTNGVFAIHGQIKK